MKNKAIIITISSILILAGGGSAAYAGHVSSQTKNFDNVVYPSVKVEDVDLSGKSKEDAKKLITEKYGNEVLKKKVNIKTSDKTYAIEYSKLNAKYNIDEVVNEAYSYGKDKGMFAKYNLIKKPVSKEYKLKFNYEPNIIKETLAIMEKEVNKEPINAKLSMVSRGKFSVTPDVKGQKLNTEQLEKDILSKINGELSGDIDVQAPIEMLQAGITGDKLSAVNTKISSFTTNYSSSSEARANNVALAAKSINGTVIMPGDTFSFNGIVGERTTKRGYMEAPVIVGNKVESGLGGGICQVSSTLYNAMLRANIKASERVPHTLPSSYVGLGMDATVDWGNIDYKFKNTLDYPIYIEAFTENRNLYFNVYSESSLAAKTYEIYNEIYETTQPNTKYIDDPNLEEGQTEIVQKAYVGYKVKVYKKTYQNGNLVSTDVVSNDTYKPVEGEIKRGTKKK